VGNWRALADACFVPDLLAFVVKLTNKAAWDCDLLGA
jgi:hypothetical protein